MFSVETATLTLDAVALYLGAGFLFALAFLTFGVARIDPAARATGLLFRLTILPGVVTLWPAMLTLWIKGGTPRGGG